MKKLLLILLTLFGSLGLYADRLDVQPVYENDEPIVWLQKGETKTISLKHNWTSDSKVIDKLPIRWTLNNPEVVSIVKSSDTSITVKAGNIAAAATISGYVHRTIKDTGNSQGYLEGENFACAIDFMVEGNDLIPVTSISLSPSSKTISVSERFYPLATILPSNALSKKITWTSSNADVAPVGPSGDVTGLREGVATITATTNADNPLYGKCSATCVVTVTPLGGGGSGGTSVSITPSSVSLSVNSTKQLSATVSTSSSNKTVSWSSTNSSVASVSSSGLVTAKAAGTATIKATANDGSGKYGTCTVSVSGSSGTVRVTNVSITPPSATMYVNDKQQLSATVSPSNATNKNVTWSSGNTSVATVSSTGLVTAKAAGTVTIKATAADGSGVYGSCTVTVTNVIPPTNTYTITVTSANTSMGTVSGSGTYESGQTVTVKATPASGYRFVKWSDGSVQNPYTFTATKDISLTATFAQTTPSDVLGANDVKPNKSYIIYTDVRGGLTVRAQNDTRIWGTSEEEVSLSNTFQHFAFIKQGDNLYLYNVATKKYVSADLQGTLTDQPSAPITFADASNGTVRLVFDASHNINLGGSKQVLIDSWTYKDDGNSFRIIEAADFYNGLVTNVTVSPSTASLTVGDTQQLSATVSPSNATNKNVTWSSGNTSIATVSSTGLVTAKAAGTVTIKATAADGSGVYGSCTVTIKNSTIAVSSISVTPSTASLTVGTTKQLSATVSPSNATNKNVTWSSSNTSIATVSSTGLVTAKAAGKVTIKATAADGSGVYGSCTITITNEDDKYNREPSSPTTFNINQFDNVYVEEDSSDGRSYSWISLFSSDYVIYLLAFTSSQSDTGIAPGTYPINSSYMEGTILASPGRNDGGDSPSAIVTDFVEGEDGNMHYQTVYYIVSGTFTVAKEKNGVRMTLNAKTFYGSTINASFVGGNADGIFSAFTPKDTPTSTKKVLNGHQLLIKNGSRTWDVHGRLLN